MAPEQEPGIAQIKVSVPTGMLPLIDKIVGARAKNPIKDNFSFKLNKTLPHKQFKSSFKQWNFQVIQN